MNRHAEKYRGLFLFLLLAVLAANLFSCASDRDRAADSKIPAIQASQEKDTGAQEEPGTVPGDQVKKSPSPAGDKDGTDSLDQGGNSQGQTFRQSVNKLNSIDNGQNSGLDETK